MIIDALCKEEVIDINDQAIILLCKENNQTIEEVCENLRRASLASLRGKELELITDKCACVIMPDGRLLAADDKSGRLTNYVKKEMGKMREDSRTV